MLCLSNNVCHQRRKIRWIRLRLTRLLSSEAKLEWISMKLSLWLLRMCLGIIWCRNSSNAWTLHWLWLLCLILRMRDRNQRWILVLSRNLLSVIDRCCIKNLLKLSLYLIDALLLRIDCRTSCSWLSSIPTTCSSSFGLLLNHGLIWLINEVLHQALNFLLALCPIKV